MQTVMREGMCTTRGVEDAFIKQQQRWGNTFTRLKDDAGHKWRKAVVHDPEGNFGYKQRFGQTAHGLHYRFSKPTILLLALVQSKVLRTSAKYIQICLVHLPCKRQHMIHVRGRTVVQNDVSKSTLKNIRSL